MRVLELFSGTQSVGKVARARGWEVVSLDVTDHGGKHPPTIRCDILEWDYRAFPPGHFDVVWASPPCRYYSAQLQRCNLARWPGKWTQERWDEKLLLADRWVRRTLEIIRYFRPAKWFLENSGTGMLNTRPFMAGLDCVLVDYCRYCDWGYRKRTRIYTNVMGFTPLLCNRKCGNMEGRRHRRIPDWGNAKKGRLGTTKLERYRVPPKLIAELFDAAV